MTIQKDAYEADVTLMDKYHAFSGELLRISLLGIALLGFFIEKVVTMDHFTEGSKKWMLLFMGISALSFALATAAALAHRFYSTDAMFYRMELLRQPSPAAIVQTTAPGAPLASVDPVQPAAPVHQTPPTAEVIRTGDQLRRLLNRWFYGKQISLDDHVRMRDTSEHFAHWFLGGSASFAGFAAFILIVNFAIALGGYQSPSAPTPSQSKVK